MKAISNIAIFMGLLITPPATNALDPDVLAKFREISAQAARVATEANQEKIDRLLNESHEIRMKQTQCPKRSEGAKNRIMNDMKLGDNVRSTVSSFTGILTATANYLHGVPQGQVTCIVPVNGETKCEWFALSELELVEEQHHPLTDRTLSTELTAARRKNRENDSN